MDVQELGAFIRTRFSQPGHRIFRMEALPAYAVASDGDDYHRWLAGEPEPTWSRKQRWLDELRARKDNGQFSTRVRIFSAQLTDYERYACEFGYAYNYEAGEDIRVLHRGEHDLPEGLIESEFWLINDDTLVHMHYGDDGSFLGADVGSPEELAAHLRARDAAWAVAEPFPQWWARHPELYRQPAV